MLAKVKIGILENKIKSKDERIERLEGKVKELTKQLKEAKEYIEQREQSVQDTMAEFDDLIKKAKRSEEVYRNKIQEYELLKRDYKKQMDKILK